MLKLLKVRLSQGQQFIKDVRAAKPLGFRGLPSINQNLCKKACKSCVDSCPTSAIKLNPLSIDLGKCIFCGECELVCPEKKISFSCEPKMASSDREQLIIREGQLVSSVHISQHIKKIFGRSLKLRSVVAGGCNACELELNALSNVNFDMGRFGIDFVASPRHADALVISGPLTRNMSQALSLAYEGMPEPKFVIAVGACAISGGIFENSNELDRSFLDKFTPALYIPGCPPHPLTFINGILDLLGYRVS